MSQIERHKKRADAQLEAARQYADQRESLAPNRVAWEVSELFPGISPYRDFRFSPMAFIQFTGRWPNGEPCTDPSFTRAQRIIGG